MSVPEDGVEPKLNIARNRPNEPRPNAANMRGLKIPDSDVDFFCMIGRIAIQPAAADHVCDLDLDSDGKPPVDVPPADSPDYISVMFQPDWLDMFFPVNG